MADATPPQPASTPQRRSGLAVASLLCALFFACPLLTFIGVICGVFALSNIRKHDRLKGTNTALAGIVLGLIFTGTWVYLGSWAQVNIRERILSGPIIELEYGMNDDIDAMRDLMYGDAATASDQQTSSFVRSLVQRYGMIRNCTQDPTRRADGLPWDHSGMTIAYIFEFEGATMPGAARFQLGDAVSGARFDPRFSSIIIFDDQQGDLVFPSSEEVPSLPPVEDESAE